MLDNVKEIFFENNPILIGVTMTVNMLHTIFEMLSIKHGKNHLNYFRHRLLEKP